MNIDLFQSRANYNEICKWWSRKESGLNDSDELIMRRIPTGIFHAKEVTAESSQNEIIGGAFMIDKSTITIKSPDNLEGIKTNDIVLFQDEKWFVVDFQKQKSKMQNSFFSKDAKCSHYWYLELRK